MKKASKLRAVQFRPKYCEEAEGTLASEWDSTHDLSVITPDGKRIYVGKFKHADWAFDVGKMIELHGLTPLSGFPRHGTNGKVWAGLFFRLRLLGWVYWLKGVMRWSWPCKL